MHPFLPLGLLLLASFGSGKQSQPSTAAKPTGKPAPAGAPPRKPSPPKSVAKPAQPSAAIRPKPNAPKLTIEHPNVTSPAAEQAAVDAAVSQAIRDMPPPPPPFAGPSPNAPPAPVVDAELVRSPREAAQALLKFLIATGRFGSKTARQPEIAEAQRDLGVTADGILGPKTREAAKRQGVALPARK